MKTIIGDILDVVSESGGILVHQVNCQRVAGAGLALQIRQRWPEWYEFYRRCSNELGSVSVFLAEPAVIVASLCAQQVYSRNTVQTDYVAFDKCLRTLQFHCELIEQDASAIYFPHGIGCGLAGGFWPSIHWLILRRFPDAMIVQLPDSTIADSNLLLDNIAK